MATTAKRMKAVAADGGASLQAVTPSLVISAPNMQTAMFAVRGTSPLVLNRFSHKAHEAMRAAQEAGGQSKSKKNREAKNFEELFESALYRAEEGWYGIHAASIRLAMIAACRLVAYKMTLAKLSFFVLADGRDAFDGTPLVRIIGEPPVMDVRPVRNANGSFDLRPRPMWKDWQANPRIQWDLDQFSLADIGNLLLRAGLQVGIGEGRAGSRMSAGIGWGAFTVEQ